MDEINEQIRKLAIQVRDERKINANTATRIGSLFLALADNFERYLSKAHPDQTDYLLKLLGGIEIGQFIDSMIVGTGASISPNGRAQFQSVEIRESLKVLELIYNRLSAMEGDFIFTESGTVDSVELIDESTYRLKIRKRHDNDFTAFKNGDVLRGVVNNLSSSGEYHTVWSRVLNANTVTNTVEVLMYPDAETPAGVNHAPTELMVLQRWGNTFDKARQSTWYLSSSEGRIVWLTGVTHPILTDANYGSFYGKPVQLSVFDGKSINYDQPYLYVRGMAVQDLIRIDYLGNIIRDFRDRGAWQTNPAEAYRNTDTLQDDVWHVGCKWRCLIDQTKQEPKWNATGWQLIEGNSNLSMQFASSAGDMFFAGQVSTAITPCLYLGHIDISNDILPGDWQWTRDSGNVTEDNAWAIAHATNGRVLSLSNEDMGSSWGVSRKTAFICTAYLRDGEHITGIENRVIV